MSTTTVGVIGIILMVVLLFSRMPVAFVMAFLGVAGFAYLRDFPSASALLATDLYTEFSHYGLTVIPLFVLMGQIAYYAGISRRLYDSAYVLVGHLRGGLAIATVGACAAFSAVCGSTNATAATMAVVTLPEMKRYGYDDALATGTVAAAGSLGILIPPSVIFIVYGILTEQSIGKLFASGVFPGLILAFLFVATVVIRVWLNPALAPAGEKTSIREKAMSFLGVGETLALFIMVIGGMFLGIFTPTEAAAVGAALTLLIAVLRRQISWADFVKSLLDTTRISCMVMTIVACATVFGHFMNVTFLPNRLAEWVVHLAIPAWAVMCLIILIYLVGGFFMDSLAMIMLTVPIFYPVILQLGFDPIWFGVIIVLVTEMGVITPPVGVNVYVVAGIAKDVPLEKIFRGVAPMVLPLLILCALLIAFPQIALYLPSLMK